MPSNTYNFTGGWVYWTVPAGVKSINVQVDGAGSGNAKGGRVTGKLDVTPGRRLAFLVGEAGNANSGGQGGDSAIGGGGAGGDGVRTSGGDSGGGYSIIRVTDSGGKVLCVAGGAGGTSGDGGKGGDGGTTTGESGSRGNAGSGATGAATGGTQTQGGSGGTSSSGSRFAGGDPSNTPLVRGGTGGDTGGYDGPGGGGGGGGWHPGGGGQGGSDNYAPAGGGAGGSNFTGELNSPRTYRGVSVGHGQIAISWVSPAPAVQPPNTPSSPNPAKGTRTRSTGKLDIGVRLSDPAKRRVRSKVLFSYQKSFTKASTRVAYSDYVKQDSNDSYRSAAVHLTGLQQNRHYYVRIYAQNDKGKESTNYVATDFYTNYDPQEAVLQTPANGFQNDGLSAIVFTWKHVDPDGGSQASAQLQIHNTTADTDVDTFVIKGSARTFTIDGGSLAGNSFYNWRVRTADAQGRYGPWSDTFRFYVAGVSVAPRLLSPVKDAAVDVGTSTTFDWRFIDPGQDVQLRADLRYRVVGTKDWITHYGTETMPGVSTRWTFGARLLQVGERYEWQVRTYDSGSNGLVPSDWSTSGTFVTTVTPGYLINDAPVTSPVFEGELGHGHNRVALMRKGGIGFLGEFHDLIQVRWSRVRDDISECEIQVPIEQNDANWQLAAVAHSWLHELKVHRSKAESGDGSFVWEGPITNIRFEGDKVTIKAQDVMVWPYRRAMRQGFTDAYPAKTTVVERAGRILINALAIDDPNVLAYLTMIQFEDDTRESRVRPDLCSTAWAEVDDMAAKAGLDYTVVGRRIILNDTHRAIGKLPQMTDADFQAPLIVTEYGMLMATDFWVTNGSGVYGGAHRPRDYGVVEMVTSAYGESETISTTP